MNVKDTIEKIETEILDEMGIDLDDYEGSYRELHNILDTFERKIREELSRGIYEKLLEFNPAFKENK